MRLRDNYLGNLPSLGSVEVRCWNYRMPGSGGLMRLACEVSAWHDKASAKSHFPALRLCYSQPRDTPPSMVLCKLQQFTESAHASYCSAGSHRACSGLQCRGCGSHRMQHLAIDWGVQRRPVTVQPQPPWAPVLQYWNRALFLFHSRHCGKTVFFLSRSAAAVMPGTKPGPSSLATESPAQQLPAPLDVRSILLPFSLFHSENLSARPLCFCYILLRPAQKPFVTFLHGLGPQYAEVELSPV